MLLTNTTAAYAQEGALLTSSRTRSCPQRVPGKARSRRQHAPCSGAGSIEIGLAAVWLALAAASLDTWFAELVRRILFVGFFAFFLEQGPNFAQAVVDSLFAIGSTRRLGFPCRGLRRRDQGGIRHGAARRFGVFEDNALAIASVIAMGVVVVSFSLVAAIFLAVMVEMYVGLLAGIIMLG